MAVRDGRLAFERVARCRSRRKRTAASAQSQSAHGPERFVYDFTTEQLEQFNRYLYEVDATYLQRTFALEPGEVQSKVQAAIAADKKTAAAKAEHDAASAKAKAAYEQMLAESRQCVVLRRQKAVIKILNANGISE